MNPGQAAVSDIEVILQGGVPSDARTEAEEMITKLARRGREPILHARVRLTLSADPARPRPLIAQATLDVNGRPVRAQVAGTGVTQALGLLRDALARQMGRLAEHWESRRGRLPSTEPHEWRHTSEPTHRPEYFPRPADERQVVRHKTVELARATTDEAAFDLDLMDYDFHLFTDLDTDQDSVLYRAGPTGYRLAQVSPDPERRWTTAVPLTLSERPAPTLSLAEAIDRLGATGLPFLFYADRGTGRGHVLYRRYDGHYGLITPVS